jgi:hypothetical protein
VNWQVYRIGFGKPISSELLMSLNFLALDPKSQVDIDSLYLLSREAQGKSLLDEYHEQKQALSKYCIGALLLTEPVLTVIRRELKRLSPDVRIEIEEIQTVLAHEVIKRDVLEGDKASEANKKIARAASRALRAKLDKGGESEGVSMPIVPPVNPSPSDATVP